MVGIYLLVTVLVLVAISSLVSSLLEEFLVSQRTQDQLQETARLALEVAPYMSGADVDELFTYIEDRAYSMGGRVLVLDSDAVVQMDSASRENGFLLPYREVREVLREGKDSAYGFHHILRGGDEGVFTQDDQSIWAVYYTVPLTISGHRDGAVLFSASIQDVVDSLNEVTRQITVIFVAVVIIIIIAIFLLSGWITKPIVELTSAIRRMGTQGYVRVDEKGSGEIAELGRAFNRMSERIEDHDRVRDEFVANASHELKTPLATMKLLSENVLYQDTPDPAMMKEFFGDVNHEVDRLTRIVTELLRLVQEDTSDGQLNLEKLDLGKLVGSVCTRLDSLAGNKNIKLVTDLRTVTMDGDRMRLEQVAMNLVENAIKYTDEGTVSVRVAREDNYAVLEVKDTGIGIPEESIEHLFERFYRVDKARSRSTGGTGLGLSITEKLVTQHHGKIEVKSKLGEGSCFTVRIPIRQESEGK
ncbi:MAG: HAMP domain-containing sensor histidine kinase [Eubacteriales bacterium]|nr:HAMP domain-containing sensor histidine kinase [Eubacteriales bacterium]